MASRYRRSRADRGAGRSLLSVSPSSLTFNLAAGQQQTQSLTVSNPGTASLTWSLSESGGDVTWLSENTAGGTLAPSGSQTVQVTANAALLGGSSGSATIAFQSNAGKQATAQVSVAATVGAYQQRVNAGGSAVTVSGNLWAADKAFTAGSWGYTNVASTVLSTRKAIAATVDDALFRSGRVNPTEYRFTVPNGTYRVELRFAELKQIKSGGRIFNVTIE